MMLEGYKIEALKDTARIVTQASQPKTSSTFQITGVSLKVWQAAIAELAKRDFGKFLRFCKHWEPFMVGHSRKVILELANLHDSGGARFRKLLPWYAGAKDEELLAVRRDVRQVWARKLPASVTNRILKGWTDWKPTGPDRAAWVPFPPLAQIWPTPGNLRGVLVIGVMQNYTRLAICANPDCPAPYFISRRKDQRYCERGECTAYAQRQYALKWWKTEGRKRRRNKRKPQGKKSKRRTRQ